jgi:hypothetical protein
MGPSGTGKSTLAGFVGEQYDLKLNPVGSRSTAKAMGFVNDKGEGDPYAVDRACAETYDLRLSDGDTVVQAADWARGAWAQENTLKTVRPLFQTKLAEAKIVWETEQPKFVTDRTPLDDLAYALMHCPDVVTPEFRERAYAHMRVYDVIVYCPLRAGQWLGGDPARMPDPMYHWRYDVLLQGLRADSDSVLLDTITFHDGNLETRKADLAYYIDAAVLEEGP